MDALTEASLAIEQHYTPEEIADRWKLHPETVKRMFAEEPGVLSAGAEQKPGKRKKVCLRIPESVLQRVHLRRTIA